MLTTRRGPIGRGAAWLAVPFAKLIPARARFPPLRGARAAWSRQSLRSCSGSRAPTLESTHKLNPIGIFLRRPLVKVLFDAVSAVVSFRLIPADRQAEYGREDSKE